MSHLDRSVIAYMFRDELGVLSQLLTSVRNFLVVNTKRRIVLKDGKGSTFASVPLTVAAGITILLPVVTGFAAIAALVLRYTLSVEHKPSEEGIAVRKRTSPRH